MRLQYLFCILLLSWQTVAQINIWPLPQSYTTGTNVLSVSTQLNFQVTGISSALLTEGISRYTTIIFGGCTSSSQTLSKYAPEDVQTININVKTNDQNLRLGIDESYYLQIPLSGPALLVATTVFGALHGLETFSQLVVPANGSCNFAISNAPWSVTDSPRFPHRGILLDTSRNYFPVADILRTLDGMSYNKLNVFHWHVVDSQSFPIVSSSYPYLSEKGAYSASEVYTKQDVQTIVNYALQRGIRVIPEFDTPGHTYSWGIGYPNITVCGNAVPWTSFCNEPPCGQLNPTKNETYDLLGGLFAEMTSWFPDQYFHIGSDEVNSNCWLSDSGIQQWMKQNGITTVSGILQYFEDKEHSIIRKNGKTPINWEEVITEHNLNLDKSTLIQVWLGSSSIGKITSRGFRVIVSTYTSWYLDCGTGNWVTGGKSWCDPFKTWQMVYTNEPTAGIPVSEQDLIIGGEVALFSEQADGLNVDQKLWPRASAAAERLWSSKLSTNETEQALPRLLYLRELLVKRGLNATPLQPTWCRLNPGYCV
eukprot:TRINITY_DN1002_c0_g2_i1.p1 TRINITY_DN1002_c0_g2~~TRINITY_DN1002_c0_g2_i1.p1  ORF type:complete len:536 (+),score=61.69 TRINITY_DN1002_c0_g2_i1:45-1652(+)